MIFSLTAVREVIGIKYLSDLYLNINSNLVMMMMMMMMTDWKGRIVGDVIPNDFDHFRSPTVKASEEGLCLEIFEGLALDQWQASIPVMWPDVDQWEGSISI